MVNNGESIVSTTTKVKVLGKNKKIIYNLAYKKAQRK